MNINQFYKRFEEISKEERFEIIETVSEPTSLFVIFQQLGQVRAQKKFFEEREAYLLRLAETGFKKIK